MLNSINAFICRCVELDDISDAYDVFEDECTAWLRKEIYKFAEASSPEPFRSAMNRLGFEEY
jgi:hypothetical protein